MGQFALALVLSLGLMQPAYTPAAMQIAAPPPTPVTKMLATVIDAVVVIETDNRPSFDFMHPDTVGLVTNTQGSGVIFDSKQGLVITNNHVIAKSNTVRVRLANGLVYQATIIGTDADADIAVLKITAPNLKSMDFSPRDALLGETVYAIGNPFALGTSVSSGIISAINRGPDKHIQTDAAINHGNSGGPLVNVYGQIVGINVQVYSTSQSAGNIGIGFAINLAQVQKSIKEILSKKEGLPVAH